MKKQDLQVIKLQIQYATLSEMCEHFRPNSKHEAYIHINKKMEEILSKLSKLKQPEVQGNENSGTPLRMDFMSCTGD